MEKQKTLETIIQTKLENGDVQLPVCDGVALRIDREVRENNLDADLLCAILEEDQVLVSELLRMANSPMFAARSPVSSLKEASVRLGVRQLASLVFSVSQKRLYSASARVFKTRFTRLWKHTSAVSMGARWIANNSGYRAVADEAFVAGLLHDIGKLSLLCVIEQVVEKERLAFFDQEIDDSILNKHCAHGATLLDAWNMPENFKTVVLQQEQQPLDSDNIVLCIIRLVEAACLVEGIYDIAIDKSIDLYSMEEVQALSLVESDIDELCEILRNFSGLKKQAA